MQKEAIDLLNFIPAKIICGEGKGQEAELKSRYNNNYIYLSYKPKAQVEQSLIIPRFVSKSKETFEVLGLLQAEMGKTMNGCLAFCNHEYQIIKRVMKWFKKELELDYNIWKWYIKLNMQDPTDKDYKNKIEEKVIKFWLNKTDISDAKKHPKTVTYIKNTKHTKLKENYYGTLILEYKSNLFSQVIKNYVKLMSYDIINLDKEYIKNFISGIIAGEGCIECDLISKKFRVHISASKQDEKQIYIKALALLGIEAYNYPGDKIVISKRENNVKLLKQRIMTISHKKYNKFLNMMKNYPNISEETGYFKGKGKNQWNKIPEEKISQIIDLYNFGVIRTSDIAEKTRVSRIKVQRVLKENNLGKRLVKTPEDKRKEIAEFVKNNSNLRQYQIAKHFNVHETVVRRSISRYKDKN